MSNKKRKSKKSKPKAKADLPELVDDDEVNIWEGNFGSVSLGNFEVEESTSLPPLSVADLARYHLYVIGMALSFARLTHEPTEPSPTSASGRRKPISSSKHLESSSLNLNPLDHECPFPPDIWNTWKDWAAFAKKRSKIPGWWWAEREIKIWSLKQDILGDFLYVICSMEGADGETIVSVVLGAKESARLGQGTTEFAFGKHDAVGIDGYWGDNVLGESTLLHEIALSLELIFTNTPMDALCLCGFGRGGALAILSALWCTTMAETNKYKTFPYPIHLYTFGAPRVGDARFAQLHNDLEREGRLCHVRYVNRGDLVPSFPFVAWDDLWGYYTVGLTVILKGSIPKMKAHSMQAYWHRLRFWNEQVEEESSLILPSSSSPSLNKMGSRSGSGSSMGPVPISQWYTKRFTRKETSQNRNWQRLVVLLCILLVGGISMRVLQLQSQSTTTLQPTENAETVIQERAIHFEEAELSSVQRQQQVPIDVQKDTIEYRETIEQEEEEEETEESTLQENETGNEQLSGLDDKEDISDEMDESEMETVPLVDTIPEGDDDSVEENEKHDEKIKGTVQDNQSESDVSTENSNDDNDKDHEMEQEQEEIKSGSDSLFGVRHEMDDNADEGNLEEKSETEAPPEESASELVISEEAPEPAIDDATESLDETTGQDPGDDAASEESDNEGEPEPIESSQHLVESSNSDSEQKDDSTEGAVKVDVSEESTDTNKNINGVDTSEEDDDSTTDLSEEKVPEESLETESPPPREDQPEVSDEEVDALEEEQMVQTSNVGPSEKEGTAQDIKEESTESSETEPTTSTNNESSEASKQGTFLPDEIPELDPEELSRSILNLTANNNVQQLEYNISETDVASILNDNPNLVNEAKVRRKPVRYGSCPSLPLMERHGLTASVFRVGNGYMTRSSLLSSHYLDWSLTWVAHKVKRQEADIKFSTWDTERWYAQQVKDEEKTNQMTMKVLHNARKTSLAKAK